MTHYDAVLSCTNLTLERGDRVLVRDISLALEPGQALVLTGPNGAGKTTLLRALAGLLRPAAGEIALEPGPAGWLGHAEGLKPAETVRQALDFWAALSDQPRDAVEGVMRALALGHLARRPCGALSAGQKRRAGLARLALSGRAVWLMDEPSAPLDAAGRERLSRLAQAHRARGGIILAATHADLGWPDVQRLDLGAEAAA
ncbi:heme ABC exporter ATP-binding protein CcmA [Alkalicaulis satelles]|uniref:Heme ABC exporter ATP-binding protein CcmA n=1 Tax=Alkalicaulis satelles TaxID=2609175 RepID=A0A5M6ZNQ5_9PROT|nr:heme ABC exporter ATP-binding protein CcmA [Alkalicaulis satelles]KAA5803861.1 heme ABC exporter ATP-binding protein CcmA [Alkalicaulis satelles]